MKDAAWWEAEAGRLAAMARRDEERMWAETRRAQRAEILLDVAVGILRHNRDRLAKPRGGDEARLLAMLDRMVTGPAAGGTDGWISDQLELWGEGLSGYSRQRRARSAVLGGSLLPRPDPGVGAGRGS